MKTEADILMAMAQSMADLCTDAKHRGCRDIAYVYWKSMDRLYFEARREHKAETGAKFWPKEPL